MPKKGDDLKATTAAAIKEHMLTDVGTIGIETLNGLLKKQYVEAGEIAGFHLTFLCVDADATTAGAVIDAAIIINTKTYTIKNKEPDDAGLVLLILYEV